MNTRGVELDTVSASAVAVGVALVGYLVMMSDWGWAFTAGIIAVIIALVVYHVRNL